MRVSPLYARLAALQEQYLDQVDAILGGLESPVERLASLEEMRRQVGCLLGELGDRKRRVMEDQAAQVVCAMLTQSAAGAEEP
jgi:hypothetical protein